MMPPAVAALARHIRRLGALALSTAPAVARPKRFVPPPNAAVPDVKTFLTIVKRGCERHISKFASWPALFTMDSAAMEAAGIPCRTRKMILGWVERFRQGVNPYYIRPSQKFLVKARRKRLQGKAK